ncbi:phospholipase A1-like [Calliopsis andreniformis]|uniref:phospholipase A1-like n=1 Tax=Calliopsis andreniformis TaxID=337506 RepID=UPI003FCD7A79
MKIKNHCAAIVVAVALFVFFFHTHDANAAIISNCIFGVKSISYDLYTSNNVQGVKVNSQDNQIPLAWGKVVFVIHGFVAQANQSSIYDLTRALVQQEHVNVFSVNWDDAACNGGLSLTDTLAYNSAVKNVPTVGEDVAKFIVRLQQKFGVKIQDIVLFGHSLGAHIAGFAGKAVQRMTNQKLQQIIGMDPAGPSFRGNSCSNRLCVTDARFVQALHTSRILGYHDAIGNVDFYFHGGTHQPGCILTTCDHSRSVFYATQAVYNPQCFLGTRWQLDSSNILSTSQCNPNICSYVGLNAPNENAKGVLYVSPASRSPYCSA